MLVKKLWYTLLKTMIILPVEFGKGVENRAVHVNLLCRRIPRSQNTVDLPGFFLRFDLADRKDILRDRNCFI